VWASVAGELPVVSAAQYVEDVDHDPVVIVDGLTKNWRYPGWRIAWTVGPRSVIDTVASAGSFLDGGGSAVLQRAAVPMLSDAHVIAETRAIARAFRDKRDLLLSRLLAMGMRVDREPQGTFYVWANLRHLPPPFDDGMGLFRAGLERKVITVPGVFFDVNPGKRRSQERSRFRQYARFSFGPPRDRVELACERLGGLIRDARG
jgi:aspartate/methionine/tyrosine aminotransferase